MEFWTDVSLFVVGTATDWSERLSVISSRHSTAGTPHANSSHPTSDPPEVVAPTDPH